jgi:hypothetical protein
MCLVSARWSDTAKHSPPARLFSCVRSTVPLLPAVLAIFDRRSLPGEAPYSPNPGRSALRALRYLFGARQDSRGMAQERISSLPKRGRDFSRDLNARNFASRIESHWAWDFCNLRQPHVGTVIRRLPPLVNGLCKMMNPLARIPSWIASHWRTSAMIACAAIGIVVTCRSYLETDDARNKRAELNRKKELRRLADRISTYGRKVHERYPSGEVVVSVLDLAQQLRKHPNTGRHCAEHPLGRTKSPTGCAERVLEAERRG